MKRDTAEVVRVVLISLLGLALLFVAVWKLRGY